MRQILFATSNPAKLREASDVAKRFNIQVLAASDLLNKLPEVDESEPTFEGNAIKKFMAHASLLQIRNSSLPLMADDGGITIDALNDEPGVKTRRWKDGGTEMSDQELIDYCLQRLRDVPTKMRRAKFVSVVAYGYPSKKPKIAQGYTSGVILKKPDMSGYSPGYPFRALFYMPQYKMLLSKLTKLPPEKRQGYLSHREKSLSKVFGELF